MIIKPRPGIKPIRGHWASRGLVGYWLAGHGGNMALDLSGNGNNGTFQGDTHLVPGKFGQAWDFDGTGDYVSIPFTADEGIGALTVSCWVRATDASGNSNIIIAHYASSGYFCFYFNYQSDEDLYFWVRNASDTNGAGSQESGTTLGDNEWHHVVGVYDGANVYLYLDTVVGNKADSLTGNTHPATQPLTIGIFEAGSLVTHTGQIDNVMIWNRALSAGEIAELYRNPFCMFQIEPIELWAAATAAAAPSTAGAMTLNTGYWGPTI